MTPGVFHSEYQALFYPQGIIKSEVEESDRKLEAIQKEAEQVKQAAEDAELKSLLFGPSG